MLTSLRAILRSAARSLGVERAAHVALVTEMWGEVVGPAAAAHSRVLGMRGTVLLTEAAAGPWAQELSAQRGRYTREINRRLGREAVTEMRVRQATTVFPLSQVEGAASQHTATTEGGRPAPQEAEWELSADELTAVEQVVAEIADPEIREGARRAMTSQLKWQKRQKARSN